MKRRNLLGLVAFLTFSSGCSINSYHSSKNYQTARGNEWIVYLYNDTNGKESTEIKISARDGKTFRETIYYDFNSDEILDEVKEEISIPYNDKQTHIRQSSTAPEAFKEDQRKFLDYKSYALKINNK